MPRLFLCLFLVSLSPCVADPVSRSMPALYAEKMKPLLTDADTLLKLAPHTDAAERGGEVLLREEMVMVDEKAASLRVSHNIYRAVGESGVDPLSRDVERFHKKRSRVHLAEARTIQPDGRSLPVRDDAAFLQTPQRSADSDLYDDQAEMVLIYPDVKKGSATENIVVREELESRIPGEFTARRGFATGWPVRRDRFVLELPRALADRLRLTNLGGGVPEPVREERDGGARVRWTWEKRDTPGGRQEPGEVGADQTGPMVFLTTIPDWEAFLKWYQPLAEKSMTLSDGLKSKVDEWTRDAKSPAEITAALLSRVASDVRYVGLEFGSGDLVPRPADAVWENQYGDCKDKACLLAAMLRHKGVTAHPALINTDFPGRVERRSPDFRHFDHCITAVAGPDGQWIFCDPTIPGLAPGGIGPADGDRDVLLVKEGAEWAHTPPHDFGIARHRIEAQMDAAGAVSGWATVEAEGYNAARFAERERQATEETLRDSLQSLLERLAQGLTAVDVKRHPRREGEPYRVETYILIPGSGGSSVPFLADSGYVPQTGNETKRETAFSSWREVYEAEARITLPPGLVPAELPERLRSESGFADASGGWEWRDGALISKFRFHSKVDAVAPADFPAFAAQMRTVNAWISRPLPLKKGSDAPAAAPAGDVVAELPHLPSVEGQLRLVDSKYPDGANAPLRRAALEKSISYFPGDQEMLYRAGSQLAWLELTGGDAAAALRRLDGFQATCRSHVNVEEAALGDYFRGIALRKLERVEEALTLFEKMAEDAELSAFRRTWCWFQRGVLLEKSDRTEQALASFEEGMKLEDSDAEAALYPPWARLMLNAGRGAEIKTALEKLAAERAEAATAILTHMAQNTEAAPDDKIGGYLEILRNVGPPESFGQDFVDALAGAASGAELRVVGTVIRERLADFLKKQPDAMPTAALPEGVKTAQELAETLEKMLADNSGKTDPAVRMRLAVEAVLRSDPDTDISGVLWNLMRAADFQDRTAGDEAKTGPLLDEAVELGLTLPLASDTRHEARALRIKILRRRGLVDKARAEAMVVQSEADPEREWIELNALHELLGMAGQEGDRKETLRLCGELRTHANYVSREDALFRETVVHLLDGQYAKALEVLDELAAKPEKRLEKMALHEQAASLLKWVKEDRAAAEKWWKDSAKWWPAFQASAGKVSPGAGLKGLPLIPSAAEAAEAAGLAGGKKEFAAVAEYLLRLGEAARMDPAYLEAYAGVVSQPGTLGLESAVGELGEALLAVEEFLPEGTAHSNLLVFVEEVWYRKQDWPKTAAAAAKYFARKKEPDAVSGYAARYWGVAAEQLKRDYAPAAEALRRVLDARAEEGERPRNLWLLGHLMNLDGKGAEAVALVRGELDGGKLNAAHALMPNLRLFLEQNSAPAPMDAKQLAAARDAVDAWLKTANPAWFEWISPASLEDPELKKDPMAWLDKTGRTRPAAALKGAVLLLRDSTQAAAAHQEAVAVFLSSAVELSVDPVSRTAEWKALFSAAGLPEEARAAALAIALNGAAGNGWPRTFALWKEDPLLARAPATYAPMLKRRRELMALAPGDTTGLKTAALAVLNAEPDSNALRDFYVIFQKLLNRDAEAAAEVLGVLQKIEFSKEAESMADNLKLDLPGMLDAVRDLEPLHAALSKVVTEHLGPGAPALTEADLLAEEHSGSMMKASDAVRIAVLLKHVAERSFPHGSLDLWEILLLCLDRSEPRPVMAAMARAAVGAATTDDAAAAAIALAVQCLDRDNPEQAEALDALLQPLAAKTEWSATADWLAYAEAHGTLRTGAGTDVTAAIAEIDDPALKVRLTASQLAVFLVADEKSKLKKLLRSTPSSTLLHPACLTASLAAWRALGMKEAAELAETRLKTAVRLMVEKAWSTRDRLPLLAVFHMAIQTGDPSLVPPGLEEDLDNWNAAPMDLVQIRFHLAFVKEDWETCARLGADELKRRPAEYPLYFLVGKACAKQGLADRAAPLLATYLEKSHNEIHVTEAKALLKSLRP